MLLQMPVLLPQTDNNGFKYANDGWLWSHWENSAKFQRQPLKVRWLRVQHCGVDFAHELKYN